MSLSQHLALNDALYFVFISILIGWIVWLCGGGRCERAAKAVRNWLRRD